jgi:hypothetical protein
MIKMIFDYANFQVFFMCSLYVQNDNHVKERRKMDMVDSSIQVYIGDQLNHVLL